MEKKNVALSSETKVLRKYWKTMSSNDDIGNCIVSHASVCDTYLEERT